MQQDPPASSYTAKASAATTEFGVLGSIAVVGGRFGRRRGLLVGEEALQVVIETNVDGKVKAEKLIIGRTTPRANSVYASLERGSATVLTMT